MYQFGSDILDDENTRLFDRDTQRLALNVSHSSIFRYTNHYDVELAFSILADDAVNGIDRISPLVLRLITEKSFFAYWQFLALFIMSTCCFSSL